jgi:hypothetical protein
MPLPLVSTSYKSSLKFYPHFCCSQLGPMGHTSLQGPMGNVVCELGTLQPQGTKGERLTSEQLSSLQQCASASSLAK